MLRRVAELDAPHQRPRSLRLERLVKRALGVGVKVVAPRSLHARSVTAFEQTSHFLMAQSIFVFRSRTVASRQPANEWYGWLKRKQSSWRTAFLFAKEVNSHVLVYWSSSRSLELGSDLFVSRPLEWVEIAHPQTKIQSSPPGAPRLKVVFGSEFHSSKVEECGPAWNFCDDNL